MPSSPAKKRVRIKKEDPGEAPAKPKSHVRVKKEQEDAGPFTSSESEGTEDKHDSEDDVLIPSKKKSQRVKKENTARTVEAPKTGKAKSKKIQASETPVDDSSKSTLRRSTRSKKAIG